MRKAVLLCFLIIGVSSYSQILATTEDGKRVILNENKTWDYLKGEQYSTKSCTLKGVVTYYFNSNYGNKPDIGATIIIKKIANEEEQSILKKFTLAKFSKDILNRYPDKKDFHTENATKALKEFNADTKELFDELDNKAKEYLNYNWWDNKENIVLKVDGNGNFNTKLKEGVYEVIAVSKNRKSSMVTKTELLGKVAVKTISISKEDEEKNISFEFGI